MSHCAFRWQAKMAALGLLMCLVLLSGATCMNDLMPWLNQDTGTPATQPTTGQTTPPPTINVSSPTTSLTIAPGAVVQISWRITDPSNQAQIKVFYDADKNTTNGFTTLNVINNSNMGAPLFYNWNTTGMAAGTYYVGAQINDGTNPAKTAYAVGQVIISTSGTANGTARELNLGDLGNSVKGCIFEGMSPAGHLGNLVEGQFDISGPATGAPDGVSDMILVAPTADSFYTQELNVGEAYVVLGGAVGGNWYNGTRFSVNSIGTDANLPGFTMVGPAYKMSSSGISAIKPVQNVDGDNGSELMIGISHLVSLRWEDQDYDPLDNGVWYPYAPYARPEPSTSIPPEDDHDDYRDVEGPTTSTGYIAVLGSMTPLYNAATRRGVVLHIDEIGQNEQDHEPHARMINPTADPASPGIHGMRWYPKTREDMAPFQYDFMNNDYGFGMSLGLEDVDGDGSPEWLISAPRMYDFLGNIDFIYPNATTLWTQPPPAGADCHSYPYTHPLIANRLGNPMIWPTPTFDRIQGDYMQAYAGQLDHPIGLGDFNSDFLGDIAMSAPHASLAGQKADAGIAYLVFGRAPFGDHSVAEIKNPIAETALPGIIVEGGEAGDRLGQQMTALGNPKRCWPGAPRNRDFNTDDVPDWVIAAPGRDVLGRADAGAIAIVWGNNRKDGRFTWDQIGTDELPGVIITGANQGDEFGTYATNAGDLNGDGSDDLLIAAPGAENPLTGEQDTGAVYVIYGPPATTSSAQYKNLKGTYSIDDLLQNGPVKVRVYYGNQPGHKIGPVAGAGDLNRDGFGEILIGDPQAASLGRSGAGEVYLIFGESF